MIITEIQYFSSKIIRFQAIFKDTVEFTCALEFKISSQPFVSTATIVIRPMPVGKSFFAVSSVLPALPATRPAPIFKRNIAPGWTRLPMSAMVVKRLVSALS